MASAQVPNDKILIRKINNSAWDIVSSIPDEFELSLSNTYDNPFQNMVPTSVEGVVQFFAGQSLQFADKYYVWTGSNPVKLNIPLSFTVKNSINDVIKPVQNLAKMATPSVKGSLLSNLKQPNQDGDIEIAIGSIVYMKECIIDNVSFTFSKPLIVGGIPSKVSVALEVTAKSLFIREDVESTFFRS